MRFLKEKFDALDSKQKTTFIIVMTLACICIVSYMMYSKRQKTAKPSITTVERRGGAYGPTDLLDDTLSRQLRANVSRQEEEIRALQQRLAALDSAERVAATSTPRVPPPPPKVIKAEKADLRLPSPEEIIQAPAAPYPPAPTQPYMAPASVRANISQPPPPPLQDVYFGGIGTLSNPAKNTAVAGEDKKKTRNTVFLPPGFMTARLLVGGDISTARGGSSDPEPLFLRIQAPAVLPNMVRANLKQCFIVAEATGRLDKERVIIRTNTLSCLGPRGESIINQPIKGFVAGEDAKNGLTARVVAKMGANMARAFIAGALEGAGDGFAAGAQSQTISPLTGTSTTIIDSDQLSRAAIGKGLAGASESLKDVYLDLLKQSTPVLELKAGREVVVYITEGVELEIKEIRTGGIQ
ncbi:TraB/VirB10 family protein [Geoalkalibacter halelectricus]|uniref:TraB/VirB10 family protein n=1 Tax=Geoalkalibacter halelectricus TaxID=2847045 RepID=UPI003D1F89FE